MTKSLKQWKKDRRIEKILDERHFGGGYFVCLEPGFIMEEQHCFGEDRISDIADTMKRVVRCFCDECLERIRKDRELKEWNDPESDPELILECPECHHRGKRTQWKGWNVKRREEESFLHCSNCGFIKYS